MVKHTEAIRRQFAEELVECVWPFCGIGAERVKMNYKTRNVFKIENGSLYWIEGFS